VAAVDGPSFSWEANDMRIEDEGSLAVRERPRHDREMAYPTHAVDIDAAVEVGRDIDLSGCRFRSDVDAPTPPRYHFMAGLVRTMGASRILEVGTFHGGATMALARGVDPLCLSPQVATIDVVRLNDEGFQAFPDVHRVIADSLDPTTVHEIGEYFDDHIDLLFVDSGHDYRQAFENVAIYGNLLKPRVILLDDIYLNRSMRRMWERIVELAPDSTVDVSEPAQRTNVGYGMIECRYPFTWPEMHPARLAAWSAYWRLGRAVMPRIPADARDRVRRLVRGRRQGAVTTPS